MAYKELFSFTGEHAFVEAFYDENLKDGLREGIFIKLIITYKIGNLTMR